MNEITTEGTKKNCPQQEEGGNTERKQMEQKEITTESTKEHETETTLFTTLCLAF